MSDSNKKTEKDNQNTNIQSIADQKTVLEDLAHLNEIHTINNEQFPSQQQKTLLLSPEVSILTNNTNESVKEEEQERSVPIFEREKQPTIAPQSKYSLSALSQSKNSLSSPISGGTSTNNLLSSNCVTIKEKPSIRIHVPLKGQINVYVNFAREAEKQYGWAALHPLQAANLTKLGLSKFDHDAESDEGDESESNMEDDGKSKQHVAQKENEHPNQEPFIEPKKRKRRIQEEEYDTLDPFIDDSELFLEEIAASKDGFFVFSGPLIPKGDKVKIERTDDSTKKGRGRGGKQNTNRTNNKNPKPKENKSPKDNSGKKNTKVTQNTKQACEQLENKEHAHLQKTTEKKETKESKPIKELKIPEEDESKSQKNTKEIKDKDVTDGQKNKKPKKPEKVIINQN
ncbi:uncharacterized protein T551_02364 [Pneumocystis jirovecii RU7]|uniref:Hpc2-related domain-containing protein n=1 Tax=Pneumocystis jirovecii (strain RU7) TaxID=1408657 RepID=A0A0W4ZL38_PNEJ7|nr:uncharacterized protein T551_02364 [Pneumocystis jirovecii RU7]KTW29090.1 hypothetical protein T551_02364 [Pneumocystis jirovecii RU7]